MLRTLSVFVPVAALNDSVLAATRGLRSMRPTVFVENLGRLVAQPIAVVVVAAMGLGPTALVFAWAAPYAVALVINVMWAKALLRKVGSPATPPCVLHGRVRGRRATSCVAARVLAATPRHGPSRPWSRPHSGDPTW